MIFNRNEMINIIVRKLVFGMFLVCTLTSMVSFSGFAKGTKEEKNIEPVAKETENKESKIVRVGYYTDNDAFQTGYSDTVRKSGYAYEYYQEIAKYTGWTYEYVYGSWDQIYEKLITGEVDIMAGVSEMDSNLDYMAFPNHAMGEETYYLYMKKGKVKNGAIKPDFLNGSRIGVKEHSYMQTMIQEFASENGIQCEVIAYSGLEERMEAMEKGELDAVVTVENDRTEGMEPVLKIGCADFYFAVNKKRPDILNELNEAQEYILSDFPYYTSKLQDKYFNRTDTRKELTDREKEWLTAHPHLNVGYLTGYMPFCDLNKKTGEMDGLLPEVLEKLADYTETEISGVAFESYNEMMEALDRGEVDAVFPTYSNLWLSERQNYTQTIAVVTTQTSVICKKDYTDSIFDRIGLTKGSPLQSSYIELNYPDAEQVNYDNWKECLSAVQSGEVDCIVINSILSHFYLNEHKEFSDLHIAELEDSIDLSFAVRRSDSVLYSIINTGLSNIGETVISDILARNSYAEPEYTFRDFLVNNIELVAVFILGFILILITFFVLYWNRVNRDHKVLQDAYNREREYIVDQEEKIDIIGSLSRIYSSTYYICLEEKTYQRITNLDFDQERVNILVENAEVIKNWINREVIAQYQEAMEEFLDFDTLAKRMESVDNISMEYETQQQGWCRGSFISVARNYKGVLCYAIYAVQDINKEKRAQKLTQVALQEAYEAASGANQAKSDFLSRMSHDIRTPMNAIIGMSAIAIKYIDNKARVKDCLQKISASGKHLLNLINEVLDMSKIESGKLELAEEEFNLQELIDNLLVMLRPQLDEKEHDLHVSVYNLKHENVIGDSLHIQQVFVNILGNAVKYTPKGGTICFTVSEKETNQSKVGCYEFVFEDNGIGMAPEFIEHIFEPFSRENDTRSNREQGTGLGLSIVLNIVHMMGGDIKVESERGKGSKFTVTIYLKIQDVGQEDFSNLIDKPILVVDDSRDNCDTTCVLLEHMGVKSEWVLSGKEAVAKIQKNPDYFAVILDWKMPGQDGIDTAKAIREIAGDSIVLIFASAFDWSDIEAQAREIGVNFFISKPLFASRLGYLLKRILSGEGMGENNSLVQMESLELSGKHILLAEDNEINAEIAKEILETTGLSVDHVWNGKEALERLENTEPGYYDLVFMDIQMPVMDGYEATKAIRASGRADLKSLPIIAMTANAFAEDVQTAMRAGMNQHIAKPLEVKKIMAVLQRWM